MVNRTTLRTSQGNHKYNAINYWKSLKFILSEDTDRLVNQDLSIYNLIDKNSHSEYLNNMHNTQDIHSTISMESHREHSGFKNVCKP